MIVEKCFKIILWHDTIFLKSYWKQWNVCLDKIILPQVIKGNIFHFDLYRLKSEIELENIGFFDNLQDSIYLIEWPEIAEKFLPSHHTITIEISDKENEQARKISIKPKSVIRK